VREIEGYRVAYGHSGSEPFWTADRKTIANNLDALPATRPDLVLFLKRLGCASLYWPEIQSQHIGAGPPSIYYPTFAWHMVVYHNDQERLKDAGPLRQPYPFHSIQFPDFVNRYPASAVECYRALREHCPVALPELAGVI
jgi:hypothetical protein